MLTSEPKTALFTYVEGREERAKPFYLYLLICHYEKCCIIILCHPAEFIIKNS